MGPAALGRLQCGQACRALGPVTLEEAQVLGPRNVHKDVHALLIREVQEPLRRDMVSANRVDAGRLHPCEIILHSLRMGDGFIILVWCKGTVGDSRKTNSPVSTGEELPVHAHPRAEAGLITLSVCPWLYGSWPLGY